MTAGDHLMPPQQHVYNGLARPADELMFARTTGQTSGQRDRQLDAVKTLCLHCRHNK